MPTNEPTILLSTLKSRALTCDQLRWFCDPEKLSFETTAEIDSAQKVLGQPTAMEALTFGIRCLAPGQNVYVRGARGTGRSRMVEQLLDELKTESDDKHDFCYVHNFDRPDRPRLITLPPGKAPELRKAMHELAQFAENGFSKAMESEPYASQRQAVQETLQARIKEMTRPFEEELAANGFALVSGNEAGQGGVFPIVEGQPVPPDQLDSLVSQEKLTREQADAFESAIPEYNKQMKATGRLINDQVREAAEQISELNEAAARELMAPHVAEVEARFSSPAIADFLKTVVDDLVDVQLSAEESPDLKEYYGVNVVLSQTDPTRRPVVRECLPNLMNLLGTVDPGFGPGGMAVSDFRGVRAGALLRADQGYLVLDVRDVLTEPGAWQSLMRTLRTGLLEIVPPEAGWMRSSVVTQPEPIEISVRVILIGDLQTYYQLDHADPDFRELFKVLADFDHELPRDKAGIENYGSVLAHLAETESLPPFHRTAVAALVEHGARVAGRPNKLTARFGRIADLAREAAFLAEGEPVMGEHVRSAIQRTKDRASLPSKKFREMVNQRTIVVVTDGVVVGQINGLAVMRSGPLTYGFPARITATIGAGTAGLINIEGRAQMSGSIHTKGFHILGGLLRHLIRTQHPMAFSASIAFEQSYGGIDGDSASGAEIVCLLSALTGIPIRQSMAMTGAIDQHGNVEAIGGVNEKIEGFFDTCFHFGLTGEQGVVIPQANAGDLMLRQDIVDACQAGKFHVYPVSKIEEAIELMTGHVAGVADANGDYPAETLLSAAVAKAEEFWKLTLASPKKLTSGEAAGLADDDQPMPPQVPDREQA